MAGKVTIQDIADALGLSRNTVSKAINNTGVLADSTREKILQKAVEMGYKQFSYVTFAHPEETADAANAASSFPPVQENESESSENHADSITKDASAQSSTYPSALPAGKKNDGPRAIALLTGIPLGTSHFASAMLDKLQMELNLLGYELVMHRISPVNIENMTLPAFVTKETVSGIICFEVFNAAYSNMICDLGIPVLFVDAPVSPGSTPLKADRLLMENRSNIYSLVQEMVRRGKKRIGFAGEPGHCLSFYERYMAYREALYILDLPPMDQYCLLINDITGFTSGEDYQNDLKQKLSRMKELPDVFLCVNDFVALDLMNHLKSRGISVPDDILICGFDDSTESRVITPQITTVHIHSGIMGSAAVQLLMSRIAEPDLEFRTVYTETTLIYRESTGD